jgi:PAS domain S-box-containing protein
MTAEEVVQALAAASRARDPLMANVLATEAVNRLRRVCTAIEHIGEGLCMVDEQGQLILFNPAAERITGWSRADVEWRPVGETVLPSDLWRKVLETREVLHVEDEPLLRRTGAPFPASCTLAPVVLGGQVDGVVIAFRDVTAEKRVDEERRAWRVSIQASYEAHDILGEGLVLLKELRVAHANAAFERMSGYSLAELQSIREVSVLVPPNRRADLAARLARLEAGEPPERHLRMQLLRKDGKTLGIEVAAIAVQGDAAPARVMCVVRTTGPPRGALSRRRWAREAVERRKRQARVNGGRPDPRGPSARP